MMHDNNLLCLCKTHTAVKLYMYDIPHTFCVFQVQRVVGFEIVFQTGFFKLISSQVFGGFSVNV